MANQTRPEPKRGDVHGCWTVGREAPRNRFGVRQWWCTASCCKRQVAKPLSDILRQPVAMSCQRCKKWGAARPADDRGEELYDGDRHDAAKHERAEAGSR